MWTIQVDILWADDCVIESAYSDLYLLRANPFVGRCRIVFRWTMTRMGMTSMMLMVMPWQST